MSKPIKPWSRLSSITLHEAVTFDLVSHRVRSPTGHYEGDFFVIETYDFVNIIPITEARTVILVNQYRHGLNDASLEIPGGLLKTEGNEGPEIAAIRELEEETGYRASEVISLGPIHPNPAVMDNSAYLFLGTGVEKVKSQNLDLTEDIAIVEVPLDDIPNLITEGKIQHSLTICAFFHFFIQHGKAFNCIRWLN